MISVVRWVGIDWKRPPVGNAEILVFPCALLVDMILDSEIKLDVELFVTSYALGLKVLHLFGDGVVLFLLLNSKNLIEYFSSPF